MCRCWACIWHWKSVLFLWCNRNIYLFYNFLLHLANISNYFTILLCWSDAWYWFFIMARAPWYLMPWENLCLINKYISCHVINMLFPAFFSSWWQYFKMDPENYDNYGGVEHLKYCFEVCCGNFHLHVVESWRACFCCFCLFSHVCNFDELVLPICFGLFIFKISCQSQYNLLKFK